MKKVLSFAIIFCMLFVMVSCGKEPAPVFLALIEDIYHGIDEPGGDNHHIHMAVDEVLRIWN